MRKSTGKSRKSLEALWRRREALLQLLLANEPLLVGSVYDTLRRCGNPTCRCADRPTHRQTLLIFTKAGRRRCRFVRKDQAPSLYEAAERYRLCRKALRAFRTLQNRERELLWVQILKRAISMK